MLLQGIDGLKLAGSLAYQDLYIEAIKEIGGFERVVDLIAEECVETDPELIYSLANIMSSHLKSQLLDHLLKCHKALIAKLFSLCCGVNMTTVSGVESLYCISNIV
jgi:hypothetical protein